MVYFEPSSQTLTHMENIKTYNDLNINEKINVKSNCLSFYGRPFPERPELINRTLLMRVRRRDPNIYIPSRLAIKTGKGYNL